MTLLYYCILNLLIDYESENISAVDGPFFLVERDVIFLFVD